jgi:hypothetical protein
MRRIQDATAASLHPFVTEAIEPGSRVHTDGWEGHSGVDQQGDLHEVTIRKRAASELMARDHRVVALLKRWLLGTHQGAVSPAHLDY